VPACYDSVRGKPIATNKKGGILGGHFPIFKSHIPPNGFKANNDGGFMPLTVTAVLNAKAGINSKGTKTNKPYKLSDGGGLYLEVTPKGQNKYWRLKYRFDGKEKRLSIGVYPSISLKDARKRKDDAKDHT